MLRRIIEIDEELCNGCGICADACHEGAIEMIDGVAKLVRDDYCDGLGDCLPACPTGAIGFVMKETLEYDHAAVTENIRLKNEEKASTFSGCPGSQAISLSKEEASTSPMGTVESQLRQWPIQINLFQLMRRTLIIRMS